MERLKRWIRWAGWAAALLFIILTLAWTATNWIAARRLASAIEQWRAKGYPVTGSELAPPPVPPKENAARYYDAAFAVFLPAEGSEKEAMARLERDASAPAPQDWDLLRAWVDSNAPAFDLVRQGRELPQCRYSWEYDGGLAMRVPELTSLYQTVEALAWRARLDARAGKLPAATDAVRSALALAKSFEKAPLLVTGLVGAAARRRIAEAVGQCITSTTTLADLRTWKDLLPAESSTLTDLGVSLRGETAFTIDQVTWAMDRTQDASSAPPLPWGLATPFLRLGEAAHLGRMIVLLELCAEPLDRALTGAREIEREVSKDWTSPYMSIFPGIVGAFRNAATFGKSSALIRAGLELEITKLSTGAYPEESGKLDPTTGRPFILDRKAGLLRGEPASPGQKGPEWLLRHP